MKQRTKVCGIDVHKDFLQVCILSLTGECSQHRIHNTHDDILNLKDLLLSEGCELVALESTGIYWYLLYFTLENEIPIIVGNANQMKSIPGRKTDVRDSEWIAKLALNGLIKPSRIFPRNQREFRDLTRNRETLVRSRTTIKNRIHKILDSAGMRLKSVMKDIFGKSGRHLLEGLAQQRDLNKLLQTIPSPIIRRKMDEIKVIMHTSLSPIQIHLLKTQLQLLNEIEEKIDTINGLIVAALTDEMHDSIGICLSVPGIGMTAATTILAEVGDVRDFDSGDRLASWVGLTPSVYQSADHLVTGRITKRGSKHLRWILVQVAQTASRTKNTVLSRFFRRVAFRRGRNKAIVALARKILCILWHLLTVKEKYKDPDLKKKVILPQKSKLPDISIDDAVMVLLNAGYNVYTPGLQRIPGKGVE